MAGVDMNSTLLTLEREQLRNQLDYVDLQDGQLWYYLTSYLHVSSRAAKSIQAEIQRLDTPNSPAVNALVVPIIGELFRKQVRATRIHGSVSWEERGMDWVKKSDGLIMRLNLVKPFSRSLWQISISKPKGFRMTWPVHLSVHQTDAAKRLADFYAVLFPDLLADSETPDEANPWCSIGSNKEDDF